MPRRFGSVVLLALVVGGLFLARFRIEGLERLGLAIKDRATQVGGGASTQLPPAQVGAEIRIATFNIEVLGEKKSADPGVMRILADVVQRFDVVAVQEIRSIQADVAGQLVALVNSTGARYHYVVGPRLGRTASKEQYAYIYNTASIELDGTSVYTIEDRDDLLHREPLVAAFRVRTSVPERAFTFTLINVHVDPDEVTSEVNVLDDVVRAVRADGRNEDDVIVLGDFNADHRSLGELGRMPEARCAIQGIATNTQGDKEYDNLVYSAGATIEYTGQSGVFDVQAQYGLTMDQAKLVSDHLPVWAQFTAHEGGIAGPVAVGPLAPIRR